MVGIEAMSDGTNEDGRCGWAAVEGVERHECRIYGAFAVTGGCVCVCV